MVTRFFSFRNSLLEEPQEDLVQLCLYPQFRKISVTINWDPRALTLGASVDADVDAGADADAFLTHLHSVHAPPWLVLSAG